MQIFLRNLNLGVMKHVVSDINPITDKGEERKKGKKRNKPGNVHAMFSSGVFLSLEK
jgi:hypothetical protein